MSLTHWCSRIHCHKQGSLWLVMKYIASVSFGKDSLAMLLMLLEKNIITKSQTRKTNKGAIIYITKLLFALQNGTDLNQEHLDNI